jgi:hypothetical protein
MSDSPKLSRRDWFRLRPATAKQQSDSASRPSEVSIGQEARGLQPIAHPENHDGLDLSQLPPMREAVLTAEDVRQLFADIETLATDVLLMQRTSRTANATASRVHTSESLIAAKGALLSGGIRRLQLRYRWQDTAWIDTLEAHPDGFRLVRIAHQM